MRKHLAWYLKGFPGASGWHNKINQTDSLEAVEECWKYFKLQPKSSQGSFFIFVNMNKRVKIYLE